MEHQNNHPSNQKNNYSCTALVPVDRGPFLPVCRDFFRIHTDIPTFIKNSSNKPSYSSTEKNHSARKFSPRNRHPRKKFSRQQRRRLLRRIFASAGIALAILVLLVGITFFGLILTAPELDSISVSPAESATYIYDQEGNQLRKLSLSTSNRDIVSLEEIPLSLQQAVIAIEDERFYEHGGIDLRGIARAFVNGLRKGSFSEGASTITQQLIKNSVFTEWTQETSFWDRMSRKVQEQYLALQLEDTMSKEEILENYLNIINLGSGCYGVQSAARRYFGKDVSELTLSESTVLAAIPQNPTALSPITHPEKNNSRRRTILSYMEDQGYISSEEKDQALADNVYDRILEYNSSYEEPDVYSYYEDALIDQVLEVLTEEKGYSYDQAYRALYSGGLRIISAQNQQIQAICDEEFEKETNFPAGTKYGVDYALSVSDENGLVTHYGTENLRSFVREQYDPSFNLMCQNPDTARTYADAFRESILTAGQTEEVSDISSHAQKEAASDHTSDTMQDSAQTKNNSAADNTNSGHALEILAERLTLSPQPQASVVIIDQNTGFVQAVVGGRGEKTASLTLNRATRTTRQPGSTFKILTAYAPALDVCGQTLTTLYDNEPYRYQDGTPVSNWDVSDYTGPTTIRDAIIRSVNVVAVKCITEITPQLGYEYAQKFGISTLHEQYEENGAYSSDLVQPLALGGITQGVTNLELCGAYAAIADSGIYHKPRFFTQIYDRNGNLLVDNTSFGTRILKSSTACLLTDAMEDVVTSPNGTAYGTISAGNSAVAGKTGTTSSYKDIWFVGYTPYYTCSVWGGYDNNESLPDSSICHTYNKILWTSIMTRIHQTLPAASFQIPEDITAVTLCRQSHLPAVAKGCPDTYQELFETGTEPIGECPLHEPITETEQILIYQDLLDEIFPETETSAESETESESTDAEIINPEMPSQSETVPDTDIPGQSEPSPDADTFQQPETNSLDDIITRLSKLGLH